jgi:hypothetical protein
VPHQAAPRRIGFTSPQPPHTCHTDKTAAGSANAFQTTGGTADFAGTLSYFSTFHPITLDLITADKRLHITGAFNSPTLTHDSAVSSCRDETWSVILCRS